MELENAQIPAQIRERLRAGRLVTDHDFDLWLPDLVRHHSRRHWTPVGVAMRASQWLAERGVSRVLDVGSGAGKFCVVGALSGTMSFVGVEHRRSLVEAARSLATTFDVAERATFVHGDTSSVDFRSFDALYLYNPFEENLVASSQWIDASVDVNPLRFFRSVSKVEQLLSKMPIHSHVVTYHRFGGRIPDSYDLELARVAGTSLLRLWRKTRRADCGGCWLELDDSTLLKSAAWCQGPRKETSEKGASRRRRRESTPDAASQLRLVSAAEGEE